MQRSDAEEQGPLLGPERVGQCVSGAQTTRNREKKKKNAGDGGRVIKGDEIKRKKRVGAMRWSAGVESFVIACALYCAISSSI